jgi:hypothetical protein
MKMLVIEEPKASKGFVHQFTDQKAIIKSQKGATKSTTMKSMV